MRLRSAYRYTVARKLMLQARRMIQHEGPGGIDDAQVVMSPGPVDCPKVREGAERIGRV